MQLGPCSSAMLGCLAVTVCLQERGFICSLSVETVLWQNKSYNAKASLGPAVASHEPEPNVLKHKRKVAWEARCGGFARAIGWKGASEQDQKMMEAKTCACRGSHVVD